MRVVLVECIVAGMLVVSSSRCAGQDTSERPADAKKASPGAKPATRDSSSTVPQAPRIWNPSELGGTQEPYAEITLAPTGKPLLAIHYPWHVHTRPSVEIRWLADNEADTLEIRPLLFVANLMKGQVTSDVYDCRDKASDTPQKRTFKIKDREFELLGDRNSFGKAATTIVLPERVLPKQTVKDTLAERKADADRAARAVFFPLEGWSIDSRTLWLELPPAHFAKPGRIRVWFYRQGDMVWWKTLAWPGLK